MKSAAFLFFAVVVLASGISPEAQRGGAQARDVVLKSGRHTVVRSEAIIVVSGSAREWYFMRNVRYPQRVSAFVVEHASKAIVFHDESDVRNALGFDSWDEVAASTDYQAGDSRALKVAPKADGWFALLQRPAARYPGYQELDLADWLEAR